jgi:hypothetical protein
MSTAEYFAGGCSFQDFDSLRIHQLTACFSARLGNVQPGPWRLHSSEVMHEDPNGWLPIPQRTFFWQMSEEQKQLLRGVRQRAYDDMATLFQHWKTHPERHLEDWKESELRPARSTYGELLLRNVVPVISGAALDPRAVMEAAMEFIQSPAFGEVPFLKISSWLYAPAARTALHQASPPSPGFLSDVELIACLLPYCDAMFLDKPCRAYLNELQSTGRLAFDTRVFSLANKADFIDFIATTEVAAPPEQARLADWLYGRN